MKLAQILLSILLAGLPAVVLIRLLRRPLRGHGVSARVVAGLVVAGAVAAIVALIVETVVLRWIDVSLVRPQSGAAVLMFALIVPWEEGLKLAVAWPTLRFGFLTRAQSGIAVALAIATGFAAAEAVWLTGVEAPSVLSVARITIALPAHLFSAGLWGYALGKRASHEWRGRFWPVWMASTLAHAVCDHIVFGRGPGMIAFVAPPLAALGGAFWLAMRDALRETPRSSRGSIPPPEPVPLRVMRRALHRSNQPIMLHWIAIGALVNVGVVLVCLGLAVYLGHRLGLNFADADEADLRANAPIILLGTAVLAAFPIAGFLVARASGATSVLEPALATAVAIFAVVGLVSAMSPLAVLFAIAVAPIAFGLACAGAWFGLTR